MRLLLALLLAAGMCAAASMLVPAVSDGDYGSLVRVHIEELPGNGGVYVSVRPLAGEGFQSSISDAVGCASSRGHNFSSSLLLVGADAPDSTALLDGPSAGVAMASLLLSIRGGPAPRNDMTVTGGITPSCEIVEVGGLAEKAEAAHQGGLHAILVPHTSPDEVALLDRLHIETGVVVHEYGSLDEAYSLLASRDDVVHSVSYGNATYLGESLDAVNGNPSLGRTVEGMVGQLGREASAVPPQLKAARQYYANKSLLAEALHKKGYTYSAGNEAFLALVALAPLTHGLDSGSISELAGDVDECIGSASAKLGAGSLDVEHFSNAELRLYWASREVSQQEHATETLSQRMRRVQSLERALLWCSLADGIISEGWGKGSTNASRLQEVASALVGNYSGMGTATASLDEARDALGKGRYGAALILVSMHESKITSENSYAYTPASNWSRMLAHHSAYLGSSPDYGEESGNSILLFAMMLDRHFAEVEGGSVIKITEARDDAVANEQSLPIDDEGKDTPETSQPAREAPTQATSEERDDKGQQDRLTLLIFSIVCILLAFAVALRALRRARRG